MDGQSFSYYVTWMRTDSKCTNGNLIHGYIDMDQYI